MNFVSALKYPFQRGNWLKIMIVPTVLLIVGVVLGMILMAAGFLGATMFGGAEMMPSLAGATNPEYIAATQMMGPPSGLPMICILGGIILGTIAMCVPQFIITGYFWGLVGHWQTVGFEAPLPAWKGNWKTNFMGGLHWMLASVVLAIPMMIASIPFYALVPFVMGCFFVSARHRTVLSVLKHFGRGITLTKARALPMIGVFYLCVLLSLVYSVFASFVVTLPIMFGGLATIMYLMAEQYHLAAAELGEPMPASDESSRHLMEGDSRFDDDAMAMPPVQESHSSGTDDVMAGYQPNPELTELLEEESHSPAPGQPASAGPPQTMVFLNTTPFGCLHSPAFQRQFDNHSQSMMFLQEEQQFPHVDWHQLAAQVGPTHQESVAETGNTTMPEEELVEHGPDPSEQSHGMPYPQEDAFPQAATDEPTSEIIATNPELDETQETQLKGVVGRLGGMLGKKNGDAPPTTGDADTPHSPVDTSQFNQAGQNPWGQRAQQG